MYVLGKANSILAVDATNGHEIWRRPAEPDTKVITSRGINYWESKDRSERRLWYVSDHTSAPSTPYREPIRNFGDGGHVNLKQGSTGTHRRLTWSNPLRPAGFLKNLVILGSATNQGYGRASGDIRAFDVRTGQLSWTFHTVPRPGE